MRFFDWLFGIGVSGDPIEMDFVPVGSADCRTPEKIAEAKRKLGRPFAPEIKVARETPPSHILEHINAQSEAARKAKATVTLIGKREKR